ncbi:SECA1, partial [Symbiodinium pilosum]
AREYDDSAAGLDGWTGSEIRTWPCAAWQAFSILLSRWSARGQFPSAWQAVRQVHLPKTEAEPNSGECAAKDMRPIAIMSILWRVVSSTVASGQETTAWASAVLHEDQYGGSEGDSCAKAWWPWPAAGQQAVRAAALGHLLAASTRILGVDFYTPGAPEGEATVKRMEAALAMGKKLCNRLLPVDIRRDLWRTRIVPKAAWGHLFRGISEGPNSSLAVHGFLAQVGWTMTEPFRWSRGVEGTVVRDLYQRGDSSAKAVMIGAAHSTAFYQKRKYDIVNAEAPAACGWDGRTYRTKQHLRESSAGSGMCVKQSANSSSGVEIGAENSLRAELAPSEGWVVGVERRDDVFRVFGGDKIESLMDRFRLGDQIPLQSPIVNDTLDRVQKAVEEFFKKTRTTLFEFDKVISKQRELTYSTRKEFLANDDASVMKLIEEWGKDAVKFHIEQVTGKTPEEDKTPEEKETEFKEYF